MTQQSALKHIKGAWIIGLISAGVTLLVSVLGAAGVSVLADMGFGWWTLIDVALLLGLSFGVYRKSRAAAVLLLIYFLFARISLWASTGSVRGVTMALVFAYFYVQGIRGTFAYQAMVRATPSPGGSPTPGSLGPTAPGSAPLPAPGGKSWRWLWVLGGLVSFGFVALVAGLIYIGSVAPDTTVTPGAQVPEKFVTRIHDLALLEPGEKLLFFYSDALTDIEEGCYLLTDRNVVVYRKEYANPKVIVPIARIKDIDAEWSNSFWVDTQVTLTLTDDSQVWFPLSSEKGGDRAFFDTLKKSWEAQTHDMGSEDNDG